MALKNIVVQGISGYATVDLDRDLRFDRRLCAHGVGDLIQQILHKAHDSKYSIYLGMAKMY